MFNRARLVLAAWFTLALLVTLAAVGAVAYGLIRRDIDREIDESLVATQEAFESPQWRGPGRGSQPPYGEGRGYTDEQRLPPGIPADVFAVFTEADGTIISNPRRVTLAGVDFGELCDEATAGDHVRDISSDGEHYRFITQRSGDGAEWVHIGRSLEARDRQLRTLTTVFGVGGAGGVLAAAGVGLWLAGRALRPIRESFEAQQRFVSDASHELRTPLAVMRANGELLQRHPNDTIGANMDQVEAITAEAEAMTKLVDDLLILARADEGAAKLSRDAVALGAVTEELGRDMEALALERGLTLTIDAEPVEVQGDRHRLRQLGTILLDNALKYTPSGGRVTVRCVRAGKHAELSVADTGPGIPAAEQARIFDRFVRADSARTRSAGGTGLGLAIARWIAESHGGRISVESQPGVGATFLVRLPLAD